MATKRHFSTPIPQCPIGGVLTSGWTINWSRRLTLPTERVYIGVSVHMCIYHRICLNVEHSGAVHQTLDCFSREPVFESCVIVSSLKQAISLNAVAFDSVVWMSIWLLTVAANCVRISSRTNYSVAEIFQKKPG